MLVTSNGCSFSGLEIAFFILVSLPYNAVTVNCSAV